MKTLPYSALLLGCLTMVSAAATPTPQTVVTHQQNVDGFDLYENGLVWWTGHGYCGGETPREASVGMQAVLGANPVTLAKNCAMLEGDYHRVVRDEAYFYFFSGCQLHRKALNAPVADLGQSLTTAGFNPTLPLTQFGAVLELVDGWLYWPRQSGTATYIYRMPSDGTAAPDQLVRISETADVAKLRRFLLEDGSSSREALAVLFSNGKLYRILLGSPAISLQLGTGIVDFTIYKRRALNGSSTYCYAAKGKTSGAMTPETPAGSLVRIDASNGAASIIYTAQGNNQVLGVTADATEFVNPLSGNSRHIILAEAVMSCGELLCTQVDTVLKRHITPGAPTGWAQILSTGGGSNLRLDEDWIYFSAGNRIKKLSREVPAQELDFVADGLEVVQAIQDMNISVPLVGRHPTFARGYAYTRTNTTGKVWQPNAFLYGYLNGQLLPGSPIEPVNRPELDAYKPLTDRRAVNWSFSYLFELPYAWLDYGDPLIPAQLQLKMVVNEGLAIAETGADPLANNAVTLRYPATVIGKGRPCYTFVRLLTTGPICGFENVSDLVERARSLMPVADWAVNQYYWTFGDPEEPYFMNTGVAEITDEEQCRALDDLEDFGWYSCGDWGQRFFVGMVDESVPNFNGVSYNGSDVMVVRMEPNPMRGVSAGGGMTLAHETGHCLGRQHIMCGNFPEDQANFDFTLFPCSLGYPDRYREDAYLGWDYITNRVVYPENTADVMSYATVRWTSHVYWNALLGLTAPAAAASACAPVAARTTSLSVAGDAGQVLLLQGRLGRSEPRGYFRPIYTLPASALPADKLASYRDKALSLPKDASTGLLRQLDARGKLLSETPFEVHEGHSEEVRRLGFDSFSQWVDLMPGLSTLQVVRSNQIWMERFVSLNNPTLSILQMQVDPAAQTLYLRWQADDPDGDPLRFLVQYGVGGSWFTLRKNYRGIEDTIDTRGLPGGTEARMRIIATDGVRSTLATSEAFILPNQPPQPSLSGIKEGQRIAFGETFTLKGRAFDPESGSDNCTLTLNLTGPSPLSLTSVVDTVSVPLRSLSPGSYHATLTAIDPDGLSASTSRTFEIVALTIPDGPTPSLDGQCNDPGYTNSPLIGMVWSSSNTIPVRLLHSGSNLFVSFSNLKYASLLRPNRKVGLRVEMDGGGSSTPANADRGFFVDEDGIPSQEVGSGASGMVVTTSPKAGFTATIYRGDNTWSAEFRIAQGLLNGWNHPARIMLVHDSAEWPPMATASAPSTWASVFLGTNVPTPANRPPVAVAGSNQTIRLRVSRDLYLNGIGSYDPDGQPLQFTWKQVLGPSVHLANPNSPTPRFLAEPITQPTKLGFELVVSDGLLTSPPSQTEVSLIPPVRRVAEPVPSAQAQIQADGALQLRLVAEPRRLYRLECSSDLTHWQTLRSVYADELGLLDLTETVDHSQYSMLFFRLASP